MLKVYQTRPSKVKAMQYDGSKEFREAVKSGRKMPFNFYVAGENLYVRPTVQTTLAVFTNDYIVEHENGGVEVLRSKIFENRYYYLEEGFLEDKPCPTREVLDREILVEDSLEQDAENDKEYKKPFLGKFRDFLNRE